MPVKRTPEKGLRFQERAMASEFVPHALFVFELRKISQLVDCWWRCTGFHHDDLGKFPLKKTYTGSNVIEALTLFPIAFSTKRSAGYAHPKG